MAGDIVQWLKHGSGNSHKISQKHFKHLKDIVATVLYHHVHFHLKMPTFYTILKNK
jgi:hypothetical protein